MSTPGERNTALRGGLANAPSALRDVLTDQVVVAAVAARDAARAQPRGARHGRRSAGVAAEIAKALGATVEFVSYEGSDFNGIFDALNAGAYDCVAAGTTVTAEREKKATFVAPYLISGQSLAVDTSRLPHVRSIDDLDGLTIGNTSHRSPTASSPKARAQASASTTTAPSVPR